jgi:microcystin-dependent protein
MPLETASYPPDLVSSNPAPTDPTNQGDDHIRLLKSVVKNTLAGVNGVITRAIGSSFGFLAGPGSLASPSYAFSSNAALGLYDAGGGVLGATGAFLAANAISGSSLNSNTSVSGATGAFSGNVAAGSFSTTGSASFGAVSGTNGTFSGVVNAASFVGALPAGAIMDFAGPTAPAGWAACDGQSLSTTTYAQLFANIGYTWGGSGAAFNAPNLISRFRRHRDNATLSSVVGTLQSPVNLAHTHTYSGTSAAANTGHTHTFSGTSSGQSNGHTHTYSGGTSAADTDHTHTYSGSTGAMSANASHSHLLGGPQGAFIVSINNGGGASQGNLVCTSASVSAGLTTSATNTDHSHAYSGTTSGISANHAHTYSGTTAAQSADHTHTYSGTTSDMSVNHSHTYSGTTSGGSADNANEARPYSATMLTCIKLFN